MSCRCSSLSFIVLSHPSLDLSNLGIDYFLDTRIRLTILQNKVRAMEATRNNVQRRRRPRLKRPTRAEARRNSRFSPGIELSRNVVSGCSLLLQRSRVSGRRNNHVPVSPDQTSRVGQIPALGPSINISCIFALCTSVSVAIDLGEEKGALTLPISAIHSPGDNRGSIKWRATSYTSQKIYSL